MSLLFGADDLSELQGLPGKPSTAQRCRIERGLKPLDQQPEREDLAVRRSRAARVRRCGQLGTPDRDTSQRTDRRN